MLSGGSTMFDHFGQRLKRDLKQIVDHRVAASEVASGSLIRVSKILFYVSRAKKLPLCWSAGVSLERAGPGRPSACT